MFGERCRLRTEGVASLREPTMVRSRWRVPGATVCGGLLIALTRRPHRVMKWGRADGMDGRGE